MESHVYAQSLAEKDQEIFKLKRRYEKCRQQLDQYLQMGGTKVKVYKLLVLSIISSDEKLDYMFKANSARIINWCKTNKYDIIQNRSRKMSRDKLNRYVQKAKFQYKSNKDRYHGFIFIYSGHGGILDDGTRHMVMQDLSIYTLDELIAAFTMNGQYLCGPKIMMFDMCCGTKSNSDYQSAPIASSNVPRYQPFNQNIISSSSEPSLIWMTKEDDKRYIHHTDGDLYVITGNTALNKSSITNSGSLLIRHFTQNWIPQTIETPWSLIFQRIQKNVYEESMVNKKNRIIDNPQIPPLYRTAFNNYHLPEISSKYLRDLEYRNIVKIDREKMKIPKEETNIDLNCSMFGSVCNSIKSAFGFLGDDRCDENTNSHSAANSIADDLGAPNVIKQEIASGQPRGHSSVNEQMESRINMDGLQSIALHSTMVLQQQPQQNQAQRHHDQQRDQQRQQSIQYPQSFESNMNGNRWVSESDNRPLGSGAFGTVYHAFDRMQQEVNVNPVISDSSTGDVDEMLRFKSLMSNGTILKIEDIDDDATKSTSINVNECMFDGVSVPIKSELSADQSGGEILSLDSNSDSKSKGNSIDSVVGASVAIKQENEPEQMPPTESMVNGPMVPSINMDLVQTTAPHPTVIEQQQPQMDQVQSHQQRHPQDQVQSQQSNEAIHCQHHFGSNLNGNRLVSESSSLGTVPPLQSTNTQSRSIRRRRKRRLNAPQTSAHRRTKRPRVPRNENGLYPCDHPNCNQTCSSQWQLTRHKRTHNPYNIKCPDCTKMCNTQEGLRKHKRKYHSGKNPTPIPKVQCDVCGALFGSRSFDGHWQCTVSGCEAVMHNQSTVKEHYKKKHNTVLDNVPPPMMPNGESSPDS